MRFVRSPGPNMSSVSCDGINVLRWSTWLERLPNRMLLPCVPVATAPPTVWSMNQGNAASVHPFGAAADLQARR